MLAALSGEPPEQIVWSDSNKAIETRRFAREQTLWGTPAISLAAQAFLFTTGLAADTRPAARLLLAVVGFVTAVVTAWVVLYQGAHAYVARDWLERRTPDAPSSRRMYGCLRRSENPGHAGKWYVRAGMNVEGHVLLLWLFVLTIFAAADVFVFVVAVIEMTNGSHSLAK